MPLTASLIILKTLLGIPSFENIGSGFIRALPFSLIKFPILISYFLIKDNRIKIPLIAIILTSLLIDLLKYEAIANLINNTENIFKTLSWDYMGRAEIFFYAFFL